MALSQLAADTTVEIERLQVAQWRRMTPGQKGAIVSGLTTAVFELAQAGIRARFPHATPHEQFLHLAIQTLGKDLAIRVYPDAANLVSTR